MFEKYFSAALSETKIKFWFTSTEINSGDVFRILVFLLGGLDVLNSEMTIGNLVALIGYYTLAMQAVGYFMSFGQGYQNALAAYRRLIEIKNIPPDINGEIKLSGVNVIKICNIDYSIDGREILKNFSCKFERGKIYCIVGKNGAGKSTLMNLICGMIRPKSGQIFFDGLPLEKIDMIHARENFISFVEQKEFIRNDDLSGGERRKISIEKAFNKSADVLIMDEPDNNLDAAAISYITDKIILNKKIALR